MVLRSALRFFLDPTWVVLTLLNVGDEETTVKLHWNVRNRKSEKEEVGVENPLIGETSVSMCRVFQETVGSVHRYLLL